MATRKKKIAGESEEKIIEAARKLFTSKGYEGTKTRDIAEDAGINLALLNYYFRSKEKLFELIMKENMQEFFRGLTDTINREDTNLNEKIEQLVSHYIDMLLRVPDMPLFVLSHQKSIQQRHNMREKFQSSVFMKQLQGAVKSGKVAPIHPFQVMLNIISLTIFPFVAKNMFMNGPGATRESFVAMMEERRKMIPKWIDAMLKVK